MTSQHHNLLVADATFFPANEKLRFFPLTTVEGHGTTITTAEGRQLLDLSAGWTAAGLGYGHPAIVSAVSEALARQPFTGGLSAICPDTVGLAELLAGLATEITEPKVYLGNSGTDANDMALRACRAYRRRERIIAFANGYHGGLGLAMGVSGVHVANGVRPEPGTIFLPYPNPLRPHTGDVGTVVDDTIRQLELALAGDDIAAVIVEPIQSDGGLVVPPAGFLSRLIGSAQRCGVPVIVDEVKVGLGRTGELFDFRHDAARPDIITLGKALGGGLPLSAAIGPRAIFDAVPASALLTTGGNPVCAAAGSAVLNTIVGADLPHRARSVGDRLRTSLEQQVRRLGIQGRVAEIRGRGLTLGVDLVSPGSDLHGDDDLARKSVYRAWQLGVVVFYVGGHVLEVTPPLTISEAEVDEGARILAQSISDAANGLVSDDEIADFAGW
jgi:4-aminobutyrate aminotransferase